MKPFTHDFCKAFEILLVPPLQVSLSSTEPSMQTPGYVTETIADRTVECDRDDQNKLFISYDNLLE